MKKIISVLAAVVLSASVVWAKPIRGVNSYSGCTVSDLQKITKGTPMYGCEQAILDIEKEYQINAFFTCAVALTETGMGKTGVGASRNNLFGMRGSKGFYWYDSPEDSIRAFGGCIYRVYWKNNRKTLPKIAVWYCNSSWAGKVEKGINYLYKKMVG